MDSMRVRGATEIPTYFGASVTYSATAAATDIFVITGSATRLVRVQRLVFSGTQTVSGNVGTVAITKHSIANTGGTAASITAVSVDSTQIPASAVLKNYTVNPTVDASALIVWQPRVLIAAPATADVSGVIFDFDFTKLLNGKPLTLRGIAQELAISLGGGTLPTGLASLQVSCIWTEERLGGSTHG